VSLVNEPAFPGLAASARLPVLGVIIAILVVVFLASTVPVAQTSTYSATVTNSGDLSGPHYAAYTPPQSGRFSFSWHTESGGAVDFTVLGPSGAPVYSSTGASGSGHLFVFRAEEYQFGFVNASAETVHLTGTLSFSVPLI
jgi:hypothetical protein